ncbi:PREDICTED: probable E3 ubiquitin-protein ligase RHB1A [Tarenaya hassleriana]|uniref:probable E3 ubiquitin-protein ligase RHB1A n=1 Tax=Tarenaya hassleriana TaxID=28532 RepID=UPI00053C6071|nr:PREDICTED: probable E3 ubiquitin-protein ligase RHB1A [Tarenaya hassleriana]XP_010541121.1 PREDICTED: probable E3 ubiquitin-protein ligase RHB1A [Tarenaya hassleriana]
MGGCCCCFPRKTDNPRTIEEHVPLSHARPSSVVSTELEETNIEMLAPDIYRSPPPPMPFDFSPRNLRSPPRLPRNQSNNGRTDSDSAREKMNNTSVAVVSHGMAEKEILSGNQTDLDPKKHEMELSEIFQESVEEDGCPICLEEYETENPKMLTGCGHHFHLACILEWMERSDACPVCDKELVLVES